MVFIASLIIIASVSISIAAIGDVVDRFETYLSVAFGVFGIGSLGSTLAFYLGAFSQ